MDFDQLKQLSDLPEQELTAKLISLFGQILQCHDTGNGLNSFSWKDLLVLWDGRLFLSGISETVLTEDVRNRNYFDYAAIIYCISTKQRYAESMPLDASRKIGQPVLREIVLTLCGRNYSIEPLIAKLRKPYINEDAFFNDYSTVDEKDATEAYEKEKAEREKRQRKFENARVVDFNHLRQEQRKTWYKRYGWFIFIFLAVSVARTCRGGGGSSGGSSIGTYQHLDGWHMPRTPSLTGSRINFQNSLRTDTSLLSKVHKIKSIDPLSSINLLKEADSHWREEHKRWSEKHRRWSELRSGMPLLNQSLMSLTQDSLIKALDELKHMRVLTDSLQIEKELIRSRIDSKIRLAETLILQREQERERPSLEQDSAPLLQDSLSALADEWRRMRTQGSEHPLSEPGSDSLSYR